VRGLVASVRGLMVASPVLVYEGVRPNIAFSDWFAMIKRFLSTAGLWLFVVLAAHAIVPSAGAQERGFFTVPRVTVDATAASANEARTRAIAEGERLALDRLMRRMTLAEDWPRLPRLDPAAIQNMIQGFEVANERTSRVRYLAELTVRFRAEPVRKLLHDSGIGFAEIASKPVLILPIFRRGAETLLWEDVNEWRHAVHQLPHTDSLVPLIYTFGDLVDLSLLSLESALSLDAAVLDRIADRYQADDAVVAIATLSGEEETRLIDIEAFRVGADGSERIYAGQVPVQSGQNSAAHFAAAAAAVRTGIEESWKQANLVRQSLVTQSLEAIVPITRVEDLADLRKRLAAVPLLLRGELIELTRTRAQYRLQYLGEESQLRVALAQRDLALEKGEGGWTLRMRLRGARGRPPTVPEPAAGPALPPTAQ
jgi:Uncharacterized protein conserved in bacteria (DUF2066)